MSLSPQTLLSEPFSNQGTTDGQFLASTNIILILILDLPHRLDSCGSLSLSSAVRSVLLGLTCRAAGALLGGDARNILKTGAE